MTTLTDLAASMRASARSAQEAAAAAETVADRKVAPVAASVDQVRTTVADQGQQSAEDRTRLEAVESAVDTLILDTLMGGDLSV